MSPSGRKPKFGRGFAWVCVAIVGGKFVHFGVVLTAERKFPFGRSPPCLNRCAGRDRARGTIAWG